MGNIYPMLDDDLFPKEEDDVYPTTASPASERKDEC